MMFGLFVVVVVHRVTFVFFTSYLAGYLIADVLPSTTVRSFHFRASFVFLHLSSHRHHHRHDRLVIIVTLLPLTSSSFHNIGSQSKIRNQSFSPHPATSAPSPKVDRFSVFLHFGRLWFTSSDAWLLAPRGLVSAFRSLFLHCPF